MFLPLRLCSLPTDLPALSATGVKFLGMTEDQCDQSNMVDSKSPRNADIDRLHEKLQTLRDQQNLDGSAEIASTQPRVHLFTATNTSAIDSAPTLSDSCKLRSKTRTPTPAMPRSLSRHSATARSCTAWMDLTLKTRPSASPRSSASSGAKDLCAKKTRVK